MSRCQQLPDTCTDKVDSWRYTSIKYILLWSKCNIISIITDEDVRSHSGYILKSNVEDHFHDFPQAVADLIQSECLSALGFAELSPLIRATVGLLVATIARGRPANWPDLLPKLCEILDSTKDSVRDGALDALENILEDSMSDLKQVQYCIFFFILQHI